MYIASIQILIVFQTYNGLDLIVFNKTEKKKINFEK